MPQTFVGNGGNNNLLSKADAGIDFIEIVYGLEGDDRLTGGWGGDILDGGEGGEATGDTVEYDSPSTRVDLFGPGFRGVEVRLALGWAVDQYGFTDNVFNIENIRGTDNPLWADVLVGDAQNNIIRGLNGPDTIYAAGGTDQVFGGAGDDTLVWVFGDGRDASVEGGAGANDQIWVFTAAPNPFNGLPDVFGPGNGVEVISGTSGPFEILGSEGANAWDFSTLTASNHTTINGAGGDDVITGTSRGEVILGGAGNDVLNGGAGGATETGSDTIDGGTGNDDLRGFNGNDQLLGGAGEDTLDGWQGNDNMAGGAGVDQFDVFMVDLPVLPQGTPLSLRPIDKIFDFEGAGGVQPGTNDTIILHSIAATGVNLVPITPSVNVAGYFAWSVADNSNPTNIIQTLEVFSVNGLTPIIGSDILIV
ncbi:MAG: calcium-binding protein [Defluviicoccus sp.]